MTPFGERLRSLRLERDITQREMAKALGISSAYLSALEHGYRGRPSWAMLQSVIGYFNVIWDEAEELQRLAAISHPRISIGTGGLSPEATALANLLAENIHRLGKAEIETMIEHVESSLKKLP